MTVSEVLSAGFVRAHRRAGAILLDVIWKGIWLAGCGVFLLLVLMWLYSEIQSIQVDAPLNALRSPLGLMLVARQFWAAYAPTVLGFALGFAGLSSVAWVVLEAYFRAGILATSEGSFVRTASRHFRVFLASAIVRTLIAGSAVAVLGAMVFARYLATPVAEWRDLAAPLTVSIVVWATVWFLVTLLDTLIRSDALELLGRELFLVAGLIATLLTFEGMILASFAVAIAALVVTLSSPGDALIVAAVAALALVLLSMVRSYLLIVRFSSIAALQELTH